MTTLSKFKKGDLLLRRGDASDRVLRVRSGEIEVLREVGATSVLLGHVRDGLVAAQRRGFRRLLAMCPQFLGDGRGIAFAGLLGCFLDAPFDGVPVRVENHFLGLVVGPNRGMRFPRHRNHTIQRLQGRAPGRGFLR